MLFCLPEYIEYLVQANARGSTEICDGTFLNPGSWGVALLAAGSTMSAMDHILSGQASLAYALVRPPGHHAQPTRADGYCFLNNAGLAIKLALNAGIKRIVTIDIDVHYGNGTAEGFYDTNDVLTISLHMNHGSWGPSHPQSGSIEELGERSGYGYNLNIPLPNGSGDDSYQYAFDELVVPAVRQYQPEIIVFIIGQDSSMVSYFFFCSFKSISSPFSILTFTSLPSIVYNLKLVAFFLCLSFEKFIGYFQKKKKSM